MKTLRYLVLSLATFMLPSCDCDESTPPVNDYDVITPADDQQIEPEAQQPVVAEAPIVYKAIAVHRARAVPTVRQTVSLNYNVSKRAVVTAALLDSKLSGVLRGFGQHIIDRCRDNDLCPVFVSAVMMHESANGTSVFAKTKNNVSGIYDGRKKAYVEFNDVQQCINFTINLLANDSYAGNKRQTVSAIQKRYCPVGAANDPKGLNGEWASGVQRWMKKIVGSDSVYCIE